MFTPFLRRISLQLHRHRYADLLRAGLRGLALLLGLATILPAQADTLADARRLLQQRDYAGALEKLDGYLVQQPKNAEARFFRGFALVHLSRLDEAVTVFTALTEDYPELPEPYNNLATVYALQQQYDRARMALEMAVQAHPSYALAHENLGDLYARLASQSYDQAARQQNSPRIQGKQVQMRQFLQTLNPVPVTTPPPTGR